MLRLLLLRHAKSARPAGVSDIDRPLAGRGRQAVTRMGAYLADEGLVPDLALVSSARRARETWELAGAALPGVPVRIEPLIYEASSAQLLAVVQDVEEPVRVLLMVGHNPGFEDLAKRLAGGGDCEALERLGAKYPTAALAAIDLPVESWAEAAFGSGRLERFVTPRSLGLAEDE